MSVLNSSKRLAWASLALLLTAAPVPALAAKPVLSPAVQALVTSADKAYKDGEYARASELYEQAWKSVPADGQLLFNAARAAHLGKQFERADKLYQQVLTQPDIEPKFAEKARGYLPDVQQGLQAARAAEAKEKARDADQLQRDKRYREAASAYRDAFRLDASKLDYLFRAGLAASFGCDVAVAKLYLGEYLQKAPADAPERGEAQLRLAGIDRDCARGNPAAADGPSPEPSPAPAAPASPAPAGETPQAGAQPVLPAATSGWPKTMSVFAGPGLMTHADQALATVVGGRFYLNAPGGWRSAVQVAATVEVSGAPNSGQATFEVSREGEDWAVAAGAGFGLYRRLRCDIETDSWGRSACVDVTSFVFPWNVSIERRLTQRFAAFLRYDAAASSDKNQTYDAGFAGVQYHF